MVDNYELGEISISMMSVNELSMSMRLHEANQFEKAMGTGISYHVQVEETTTDKQTSRRYRVFTRHHNIDGKFSGCEICMPDYATGETTAVVAYAIRAAAQVRNGTI